MEEKRQIIPAKSVKPKDWNLLDELQFRWILLKWGREENLQEVGCKSVLCIKHIRRNVRYVLEKYGFTVNMMVQFEKRTTFDPKKRELVLLHTSEFYYQIAQ